MGPRLRCEDYKVGWICALAVELAAAEEMLDEEHETPAYNDSDTNIYTCGRIGEHNVVIACLPEGQMGTVSAASVAHQMKSTFPSTRFGLMVGIGGGVPSEDADVRLGDIVVSKPFATHGGVVQYDFGKATLNGFQRTGFLNSPPAILLNAVTKVRAMHMRGRGSLLGYLSKLADLHDFGREAAGSDVLFKAEYDHSGGVTCVNCKQDCVTVREKRRHEVVVHYGTIASGDQVIKNAAERDRLSKDLGGVLCFEMEAAGLMNSFPCLVIRGICDYADSHKNKKWQPYAAGTAAAYAKELLAVIPSAKVEAEKKIVDVLSDFHENAIEHKLISKEQLNVAQKQLTLQQKVREDELSKQEQECLQLFRLTKTTEDATYEWYKDRIEDRVEGTCNWFLEQTSFTDWLNQVSGALLVSADPGCGKSVLAKHLVDNVLPISATVCYYFFKDQDQNTVRQALCAILHQLFSQKPSLIKNAMKQHQQDGGGLIESTSSLWTVLAGAVRDSEAEPIIIVLDALDECAELEFEDLMHRIEQQSHESQIHGYGLRFLMTSRPYRQIMEKFQGLLDSFSCIHIPGEMASDSISQEVNLVIEYRVRKLAKAQKLADDIQTSLLAALLEFENRTYLWVYLIFDHLKTQGFKRTEAGAQEAIKSLPKNVNQAYEKILDRSKDPSIVRKTLSIIFAAERALTVAELNIAMEITATTRSKKDLDLEDNEHFKSRLRSLCGLFVSVHREKVYFLHQTAREFLAADLSASALEPSSSLWQSSISSRGAQKTLAAQCVRYLIFFESEPISEYLEDLSESDQERYIGSSENEPTSDSKITLNTGSSDETERYNTKNAFFDYAATWWPTHFAEAKLSASEDAAIAHLGLQILDPMSRCFIQWHRIYNRNYEILNLKEYLDSSFTPLAYACLFGHAVLVEILLKNGANVNELKWASPPALITAAEQGHEDIVQMLIDAGAEVNAQSRRSRYNNALQAASAEGHEQIVKILINAGADVNFRGGGRYTSALQTAAGKGHMQVVRFLIDAGADVNLKGSYRNEYRNALEAASNRGHKQIVRILLDAGAEAKGSSALSWASRGGHEQIVQMLLDAGAEAKGSSALRDASNGGHDKIVEMLLDAGADAKDFALWDAPNRGHEILQMLLDEGDERPYVSSAWESSSSESSYISWFDEDQENDRTWVDVKPWG